MTKSICITFQGLLRAALKTCLITSDNRRVTVAYTSVNIQQNLTKGIHAENDHGLNGRSRNRNFDMLQQ